MAGIAIIAKQLGHDVSGSDKNLYDPMKSVLLKNKIKFVEDYNSSAGGIYIPYQTCGN